MASEGPNSTGTMVNDNSFGTTSWINVDNAKISDDNYATVTVNDEACFLIGTKILTHSGYKLIENLKIGDKVITLNNKEIKVLKILKRKSNHYYKLNTTSGLTRVTGEHPYLLNNETICCVKDLKPGFKLKGISDYIEVISKIKINETVDVYNLSVEEPKIYVANNIYVHNKP